MGYKVKVKGTTYLGGENLEALAERYGRHAAEMERDRLKLELTEARACNLEARQAVENVQIEARIVKKCNIEITATNHMCLRRIDELSKKADKMEAWEARAIEAEKQVENQKATIDGMLGRMEGKRKASDLVATQVKEKSRAGSSPAPSGNSLREELQALRRHHSDRGNKITVSVLDTTLAVLGKHNRPFNYEEMLANLARMMYNRKRNGDWQSYIWITEAHDYLKKVWSPCK